MSWRDHEEGAAGREGCEGAAHHRRALRRRRSAGRRSPRGRGRPAGALSARRRPASRSGRSSGSCSASRRPFSIATGEKSIAVTCQPRSASQRALRPSPQARSRARPGGRSASACSTNWLGPADHTSSVAAYLSSQAAASTRLSRLRTAADSCAASWRRTSSMSRSRTACDQLVERCRRQRAGLGEDQDALAEDHQRGDRGDLRSGGQGVLLLGVDRPEGQVGVGLRRGLVGRRELAARAAPARPEVDEERVVLLDALLEVLTRQLDGGHGSTVRRARWCGRSSTGRRDD